jgi:hypothetical protein
MTLKVMEDPLHINWKIIYQILYGGSGKRNICAKFLSHGLADEQKEQRVVPYEDFIQTSQTSPCSVISHVNTGKETWDFQCNSGT